MAENAPKKKPTRIIKVSYGMTVSLPQYENVKFELTAAVDSDDDWRDVLDSLKRKSANLKAQIQEEGA